MAFSLRHHISMTLLRHQKGRCGFCDTRVLTMVIDHDHITGLVRGMLCSSCNSVEANPRSLEDPAWIAYWANTPAMQLGIVVMYEDL